MRFRTLAMIMVLTMIAVSVLTVIVRAADSWGVAGEEEARFDAKVVDILCQLTGDCPAYCGDGRRQLGLLTADNKLILAAKSAANFSGATDDLIEFCGQQVTADGIFTANYGVRIFAIQFVKRAGGEWHQTKRFLDMWAIKNGVDPTTREKNQWYLSDPRIGALIEKDGFLGLGPAADQKFLEEEY